MTWGGVFFLLRYGWGNFRCALQGRNTITPVALTQQSRWQIIFTLIAVTWLNLHVWIDTFVVLGSVGGHLPGPMRIWFALGATSASLLWFFSLAQLACWLSPWLKTPRIQRAINFLVALVMWWIAIKLALGSF